MGDRANWGMSNAANAFATIIRTQRHPGVTSNAVGHRYCAPVSPDQGAHGPSGRTPNPNLMGHLAPRREIGRLRPDHPLSVESARGVNLGDVHTPSLGGRRRSTVAHTDTASRTTANTTRPTTLTLVAMRS